MKKFISLSKYPGKTGQYYYTKFFQKYNLPHVYTPLGIEDIKQGISKALADKVDGVSVSMPFKKDIIKHLHDASQEVKDFESCNTVIIVDGKLKGFNTDYYGALNAITHIKKTDKIAILGNGAMANMFLKMLNEYNVTQIARKLDNWDVRLEPFDVYINCTALGTIVPISPFTILPKCRLVIDLALKENQLADQCRQRGTKYFSGLEFYKYQFINQFKIYTGLTLDAKEFDTI